MKRSQSILILLLGLAIFSISSRAQKVDFESALAYAVSWTHAKSVSSNLTMTFTDSLTHKGAATVYRFKISPKGFLWISADYGSAPVLAYSFEQDFSGRIDNPGIDFLAGYQKEITWIRENQIEQSHPHPDWHKANPNRLKSSQTDDVVAPMMEVLWGQGEGYNKFTPSNTPTGCVSVAMVQIMRHWQWPLQPQGQHEYTHSEYGDFAIDLDTISFDWANMPFTEPTDDIAKAMYYTGIALHMNYAPDGSGANTDRAGNLMESSFGFHEKGRYIALVDFGAIHNWVRVIKNELINGRPVIYRGQGTGGHAFNFDGFDGDYFHVNWGWSGSQNGYFLVTSLTPGSHNFSDGQGAVINLFPNNTLMWDRPYGIRVLASDSKVSLAWKGVYNSELSHYNVYRNGEIIGQAQQRNYTDDTAENGTIYSYAVSSVYQTDTADYESVRTNEVTVEPAEGFLVPYSEDFEEGHSGWLIANTDKGFQWGTPSELGMGSDDTNHVIGINSGVAGNNLVSDLMISNGLDLNGLSNVVISFDYAYRKWQDVDHLSLMYRVFEENEWKEFDIIEPTAGYHDWANYKSYLPAEVMKDNIQLAFFYTDDGQVGYGALIDNITVYKVDVPGNPDFSISEQENCLGNEIVFTDISSGTKDSYFWDFGEGASPKTATSAGPHTVTYNSSGAKTIQLILNELDQTTKAEILEVTRPPRARFGTSINYKTVSFSNTSLHATEYLWNFGDGIMVTQEDPVHTYTYSGDYKVTLIAINNVCANDTIEQWISFSITGVEDTKDFTELDIYPNPATDELNISFGESQSSEIKLSVLNIKGETLINCPISNYTIGNTSKIDIRSLAAGSYFLRMVDQNTVLYKKFIKVF